MSKKEKEESKNIYQRLHAVMEDISYIQKEEKKVNNQYRFVSHDAVTAKCRGAFIKHRVLVIPTIIKHELDQVTMKTKGMTIDTLKTVVDINVKFVNIDKPDDFVETTSIGYGIDPQDKGIGKAYSYAYKYALLKALGLETGDDPERDVDMNVTSTTKYFNTRKERNLLFETIMEELNQSSSTIDLQDAWMERKQDINKIRLDCEQYDELEVYDQLVRRKDELKGNFEAIASSSISEDIIADNFRNGH